MKTELWLAANYLGARQVLDATYGVEPIVLMYHRFSETPRDGYVHRRALERQFAFLAKHCDVISASDLKDTLSGEPKRFARPPVVITIDDAYRDLYDIAYPLLRQYQFPATIFATSGFVDGRMWYWQDKLRHLLDETSQSELHGPVGEHVLRLTLTNVSARRRAWHVLADHCFGLSEAQCELFIEQMSRDLNVPIPPSAPHSSAALSWRQIEEMAACGIEVGAHTVSHRRLPTLSSAEALAEIVGCKLAIEDVLRRPARFFAYPFGSHDDWSPEVEEVVARTGFELAFVAYFDAELNANPLAIRRFGVASDMWDFVKTVHGLKRANCIRKARNIDALPARA
jgi:peptidoglycan/xylan/chitin deacetylase (PgdA/CDA1 family)